MTCSQRFSLLNVICIAAFGTFFRAVLHRIVSASSCIDICVQQLTLEDVGNELVLAHDNGIKIRIVSDRMYSRNTGSQIPYFMKEGKVLLILFLKKKKSFKMHFLIPFFLFSGIPVHMKGDNDTLHHKFIIVDRKIVISGSLNWTMQSFFGNYENLLFITEENVLSEFQREFERLWESFPPAKSVLS